MGHITTLPSPRRTATTRIEPNPDVSALTRVSEPSWLWQGRLPSLDGLRAVSIGLVLVDHLSHTPATPVHYERLHYVGTVGVEIFFVISGFLITLLLLREQRRDGAISLRGFFLRRVLRIVPAYAAFLLVLFALQLAGRAQCPGFAWARALTYTTSLFDTQPCTWDLRHTWSLSVEEHFYLLWPCLFALLSRRLAFLAAAMCVAGTPLLRASIQVILGDGHPDFRFFTLSRMDAIAVGCCLSFLATSRRFQWATRLRGAWTVVLVGAAGAIALTQLDDWQLVVGDWKCLHYFHAFLWGTLRAILIGAVVWICVCASGGLLGRALNGRLLCFLGVISYPMYLWQQMFLHPEREHWTCGWPAGLVSTIAVAAASYFLLERPLLRLKDRLAKPRHLVTVSPPAVALVGAGERSATQ
jgi:peptidoglycan/LPS O-acetylase OafA/YrhL